MEVLVPYAGTRPKTRLGGALTPGERRELAEAMLTDVLAAVEEAGHDPHVIATDPLDRAVPTTVDDRTLTTAVNAAFVDRGPGPGDPIGVVMADLALATPQAIRRLTAPDDPDLVIAPGRGGGTNALVVRHPEFRVDYHGASYRDHRAVARELGAEVHVIDSFRLSTDIDKPVDLVELLLHGEGTAAGWLRDAGFALDTQEGRVEVTREG